MFGERIDGHITMLQRIVALLRDLVLGLTIALTCVIVYFGGDPTRLSVLDWTKLVGGAALIVLGPIIGFLAFLLVFATIRVFSGPLFYAFLPGSRVPRGVYLYFVLKRKRMTKREYIEFWRSYKNKTLEEATVYPRLTKFNTRLLGISRKVEARLLPMNSFSYMMLGLILAIVLFIRTIRPYIP